ncbi:MAG: hypothetical protein IPK74_14480 [Deltaproteobacteria bacterium]|nr:hypothetical protein [Deltaproteobacteria bacterium]
MHRALARACLGLSLLVGSSACAARYQLRDADLREAREQDSLGRLRVYPSNRLVSVYDEDASRTVTVSSEIRQRTNRLKYERVLSTQIDGAIVEEAELNGVPLLWVTFDRGCLEAACAYGFVRTEDGRYRLLHVPEREGFQAPKVFRGCTLRRHRMSRGNLHALAEANQVYRYVRRRGPKTVFLEVRKDIRKRTKGRRDRDRGVGRSS